MLITKKEQEKNPLYPLNPKLVAQIIEWSQKVRTIFEKLPDFILEHCQTLKNSPFLANTLMKNLSPTEVRGATASAQE